MTSGEPTGTALLLLVAGLLMAVSVAFSRTSGRLGVPAALLFMLIGVLAGSEGIGGIPFDDHAFAFRLGTAALTLILFDGGLNTSFRAVRAVLAPAGVLATAGVVGTAALLALGAMQFGFQPLEAMLLGAVVSSTDAAMVFAVLRNSGIHLQRKVGTTLELESGLNDPMAVLLTFALTSALVSGKPLGWDLVPGLLLQLVVGAVVGLGLGWLASWVLGRLRLPAAGLYPVFTIAVALLAFAIPTLLQGSGFLAVYLAGLVLGNRPLPYRAGILRVHDAAAWFSQVAMFLILGLLVFPSRLIPIAGTGVLLALMLGLVARPLAVAACLVPFRYPLHEIAYVGWVGLRGAVPIVLATFPVLANAPGAARIFDVVFFVVVVNVVVHGGTVARLTRWLGLESGQPPAPQAVLEISSTQLLDGEVLSFYIDPASAVAGNRIADLPFPEGAAVMLVVRGSHLVAAKGRTKLEPGDHVHVFCRPEDRPFVQLLFGTPEER